MFPSLPCDPAELLSWGWERYEPFYRELESVKFREATIEPFLDGWSALAQRIDESLHRLRYAADRDLGDPEAQGSYRAFLQEICIPARDADRRLLRKLRTSGVRLGPAHRAEWPPAPAGERWRGAGVSEWSAVRRYLTILALQSVTWGRDSIPVSALAPQHEASDRRTRERTWRSETERRAHDAPALAALWIELSNLRCRASREGVEGNRCAESGRRFRHAVEEFVTPVLVRLYERRRAQLGLRAFRPWDVYSSPAESDEGAAMLPGDAVERALEGLSTEDPDLAQAVRGWRARGLLDLDARAGKAPLSYCLPLPATGAACILQSAAPSDASIRDLLYLFGVSSRFLEVQAQPYIAGRDVPPDHLEMSGVTMQLRVLHGRAGGAERIYGGAAPRARRRHLEACLLDWVSDAMVDAFEAQACGEGTDGDRAGALWQRLWLQYLPAIDLTGIEELAAHGWQRHTDLFLHPGEAAARAGGRLQAVKSWMQDGEAGAASDANRAFDGTDLHDAARWIEDTIEALEA